MILCSIHVHLVWRICTHTIYCCLCARGTIIFSQSLNWELTVDLTAGPWKGRKMKSGSDKEVAILHDHRRKRDLFEGLAENFPFFLRINRFNLK
jgi:hypothetical protein